MKTNTEISHSEAQAIAQLESIHEMLEAFRNGETDAEIEEAREAIQNDPLSVEVRGGWQSPGDYYNAGRPEAPEEFCLLLCTGGPAVRIMGTLDEHGQPDEAWIEHQDWGTPWTPYAMSHQQSQDVLEYAGHFYFAD